MTWDDMIANWKSTVARLESRFPRINRVALTTPPDTMSGLTRHLADTHDLTALEAREELADWLFVESLERQVSDQRFP